MLGPFAAAMPTRSRRPARPWPYEVHGSLWLSAGGQSLAGHGRMALLRAVVEQGSITHAAKAFGMSYKAAWDAIDAMNQRAGYPLVERVTGGRGGGSTRLTEHGQRLLARYEQVDQVHQRFLELLGQGAMDLGREFSWLEVMNMKTSARNQWAGHVSAIRAGAVNDEVELALAGGGTLVASVTRESTDRLGLRLQQPVLAFVKASSVMLAGELQGVQLSVRNQMPCTVVSVRPGAVNAEVALQAAGGWRVVAMVPQAAVDDMALAPGAALTALVQASDVIVATAA
jgi:molybdate transport system regulatory protein